MNSKYEKIVFEIAKQSETAQKAILKALKEQLTEEEYRAVLIGVSYFRLLLNPGLKEAMANAICEELYFEFTGRKLQI